VFFPHRHVASPPPRAPSASATPPQADINYVTTDEVQKVEGVGPVRAKAILRGIPYSCGISLRKQLIKQEGIGTKTAEKVMKKFEVRGCDGNDGGNNGEEWRARLEDTMRRFFSNFYMCEGGTAAGAGEDDTKLLKDKDDAELKDYDGELDQDYEDDL
jgi:hypothetical protein